MFRLRVMVLPAQTPDRSFAPGVLLVQATPGGSLAATRRRPNRSGRRHAVPRLHDDLEPDVCDADGNRVSPSAFNVGRAYINVLGQINHVIAFRITTDITRETGTGSSLSGSLTYRLKYAFAQINLDDWLWRGSYVRVGMTQTPYVEFEESVYRYRFQGPIFADREGSSPRLTSAPPSARSSPAAMARWWQALQW